MKYFDYTPIAYSGKMTRQGEGFYPGSSLITNWGVMNSLFGITRIQFESNNPFWCNEFTTMTAVPNSIRKSAYATLMYGNQMVCGWTWQSMWAGEEQYLLGMVDWDGLPNCKYDELITELGIKKGPNVPAGVMARQIDKNHFLYLNVSGEPKEIQLKGRLKSILFDTEYSDKFTLAPYEPEFIELR